MKYKVTDSYNKLDDSKNYNAFGSPAKHMRLMAGYEVEIDSVPKELEKHLESAKSKKESE